MDGNQPQVVVPGAGWVDVATRVIIQVGFPIVVAAVLLWFMLGRFTEDIRYIAVRMEANAEVQSSQLQEMKEHTRELRDQTALLKEFIAAQKR